MTTHDDFLELAAAAIDFELTPAERVRLDAHFATCPACRRAATAMRADARGIELLAGPVIPERRAAIVLAGALGQRPRSQPLRLAIAVAILVLLALAIVAGAGAILRQLDHRPVTAVTTSSLSAPGPTASNPLQTLPPTAQATARPNSWATLPSLVNPRSDAATLLVGGDIVTTGGHASDGSVLASTEAYSLTEGRWWALAKLRVAAARYAAAVNASGGFELIAGGVDGTGHALAVAEWFDRGLNEMGRLPDMHVARADAAAVTLADGSFLIVGGYGSGGRSRRAPSSTIPGPAGP